MAAPLQTSSVVTAGGHGSTRTVSLTGVAAGSALVVWIATYRYDTAASHITSVSSSNGGAFTLARSKIIASQSGAGGFRLGLHCYLLLNAASGSHTITVTFANAADNQSTFFAAELPGIVTASAVDIAIDSTTAHGATSVSIGPTAALAQEKEFAMVMFASYATEIWNGASSGDGAPPTGWTAWRSYYTSTGSPPPGIPFAAYWRDTTTNSALSASVTVQTDSNFDPFLAMLVTLRQSAGTYYVEILLQPQSGISVNGSGGWTVEMSAGDPASGATVVTGVTAQASGNELRVTPPAGTTLGQTINVVAYNTTLSHGTGTGVGTTRGTGIVKAG